VTLALAFEPQAVTCGGRAVRRIRFERRSSLPVSAACVVANGIRETLGVLIGKPVRVRLMEPLIPDPRAWAIIASQARLYEVRGALNNAAFILRGTDALALVHAIFGEGDGGAAQTLSPIEEEVLRRLLRSLAATLTPVCGSMQEVLGARNAAPSFLTFFEVLIEEPAAVRLGIAVARETLPDPGPTLRPEDLLDVELEATAEFASATLDAVRLFSLLPNGVVRLHTRLDAPSRLKIGGTAIALGQCGTRGERRAFSVAGEGAPKG